jgi:fermentation-respiration switch protein FrsA (DUF1100 family)
MPAGAAAEPASQLQSPTGAFTGKPPRGYVITIHGGGWTLVGPGMMGFELAEDARLNSWGYATLNVDYRRGSRSLDDVVRFYDRLRRRVGRDPAICADGSSSGGHLALMLAVRRPGLQCAISEEGPTLLRRVGTRLRVLAQRLFGRAGGLDAWSPALHRLRMPILLGQATNDRTVPRSQATLMRRAARRARVVMLHPGTAFFVHTHVDAGELDRFFGAERALLRRVAESARR